MTERKKTILLGIAAFVIGFAIGLIAADLLETHGYLDCVFNKLDAEKYYNGYWKIIRLTLCR